MALKLLYTQQRAPRNRGSVKIARSGIDAVLPAAQEQYANAIAVNGHPCLLYRRMSSGIPCTCISNQDLDENSTPTDGPGLGEEPGNIPVPGANNELAIASAELGSHFSVNRYGSRDRLETSNVINPRNSLNHTNKNFVLDDEFLDKALIGDEDVLLNGEGGEGAGSDAGLFGGILDISEGLIGNKPCGVCFGTGYVGGYQLANSYRKVYDTQSSNITTQGFQLDAKERPNVFNLIGSPAVILLSVIIPRGAIGLDALRIFNNTKVVESGYTIEVLNPETQTWQPFNDNNFIQDNANGYEQNLRFVFAAANDGTNIPGFTHIEIQFNMDSGVIFIEFPRLMVSENGQLPKSIDPVNLVIPPTVPHVDIYDVVYDSTYKLPWLITNVNSFLDRKLNVNGWEVTARLIQEQEIWWLLSYRHLHQRHTRAANLHRQTYNDNRMNDLAHPLNKEI